MDLSARFRAKDIWDNDRKLLLVSMLQVNELSYRNIDAETSQDRMDKVVGLYCANVKYLEEHSKVESLPDDERERLLGELENIIIELHCDLLECAQAGRDDKTTAIEGKDRILAWREQITKADIPSVITKKTESRLMLLDSLTTNLFSEKIFSLIDGKEHAVELGVKGKLGIKRITVYVSVDMDGAIYDTCIPLTQYDREILNTVITLYAYGNKRISLRMIHRELNGSNVAITAKARADIMGSLKKLAKIKLTVNMKDLVEAFRLTDCDEFKRASLLVYTEGLCKINGVIVPNTITIHDEPILWLIARNLNRVGRHPEPRLVAVGRSASRKQSIIWGAMKQRVVNLAMPDMIRCEDIYGKISSDRGWGKDEKKEKQRARKEMISVLEDSIKEHLIDGYEVVKKQGAIYGYKMNRESRHKKKKNKTNF